MLQVPVNVVFHLKSLVTILRLLMVNSTPLLLVLAIFSQLAKGEPQPVLPLVIGIVRLKSKPRVLVVKKSKLPSRRPLSTAISIPKFQL
ncbi:Uncharacterised protein [Segatella copri]|nr:Uncharacterised protein [Segatella copri]